MNDVPFRLLLLGDFGIARDQQRVLEADAHTLSELMARLRPTLTLTDQGDGAPVKLEFRQLEDFHPDTLLKKIRSFQPLLELRSLLENPATFDTAAATIRSWETATMADQPKSSTSDNEDDNSSAIERLLGRGPLTATGKSESIANQLIRDIVGNSSLPDTDPQLDDYLAEVDRAIALLLRKILHHPDFQALEAAWRGLDFLVSRLDTDVSLRVFIQHLPKATLLEQMSAVESITESVFYQTVVHQTIEIPGADPWAAVVLNHTFEPTTEDLSCYGRCLTLARAAGVPVLAEAGRGFTQNPENEEWERLRQQPEAALGALLWPPFLLRAPYGKKTDPIARVPFEEAPSRESYLWGNPALIAACLLGEGFSENDWDLEDALNQEITDVPTHVFRTDDGVEQIGCLAHNLTETDGTSLMCLGLLPLISYRGTNRVKLWNDHSIAKDRTPLAGRWS